MARALDPHQVDIFALTALVASIPASAVPAEEESPRAHDVAEKTVPAPPSRAATAATARRDAEDDDAEDVGDDDVQALGEEPSDVGEVTDDPSELEPIAVPREREPMAPTSEFGAMIAAYKATGDERSLLPLVAYYKRSFEREALHAARLSGRATPLDGGDAQSAGFEALVTAINAYVPESGIPFPAFFRQTRRAAMNDERSRLGGMFTMSRRMHTTRVAVLRAADEVRKDQRATNGPGTAAAARYALPLSLDNGRLSVLDSVDLAARRDVLRDVWKSVARHLQRDNGWQGSGRSLVLRAKDIMREGLAEATSSTRSSLESSINRAMAAVSAVPFKFSAAFTTSTFKALESPERQARWSALGALFGEVESYLERTIPGLDVVRRRQLAVDRVDAMRSGAWPASRDALEKTLQTRLLAFVTQAVRRGLGAVSANPANREEAQQQFVAEVARRANTSVHLAGHLLRLDTYGLSLDEPVEGKGGKEAGSIGERLAASDDPAVADRRRRLAQVAPFVPMGVSFVMALNLGLDGQRRANRSMLRDLGVSDDAAARALEIPPAVGRHPLVVLHVDGPEAARVAKEQASLAAFQAVAARFVAGQSLADPAPNAPTPRVRAEPKANDQIGIFDQPAALAASTSAVGTA